MGYCPCFSDSTFLFPGFEVKSGTTRAITARWLLAVFCGLIAVRQAAGQLTPPGDMPQRPMVLENSKPDAFYLRDEDGTLVLNNPTLDYMRGFELYHAKRPATALTRIPIDDPVDAQYPDGRIAPFSRLAKIFFDAIEKGTPATPGFAEGYRAQMLIDAARRSHQQGAWIDVPTKIDV
jgi:hypothetical protein